MVDLIQIVQELLPLDYNKWIKKNNYLKKNKPDYGTDMQTWEYRT